MSKKVGEINGNLLPEEIICDILTRLPAKEVCRSKVVSKRWNSIISDPNFIRFYISRANPQWFILNRTIQFTESESGSDVDGLGSSTCSDDEELVVELELSPRPGISTLTINPTVISKNRSVIQSELGQIIGSSNGLVLGCFHVLLENMFYAILCHEEILLFVSNPVSGEWARIPKPPFQPLGMMCTFGFIARVDPGNGSLDKLLVVEYQHMVSRNAAIMQCFSSDTGKWVVKEADYMLPPQDDQHLFRPTWGFEFDGQLFWVELSVGLITWDFDGDIFNEAEADEMRAKCRLIPLPSGRETPETTTKMVLSRSFGGVSSGGGRSLQYVESFEESHDCWFNCWRLEDYKNPISEWSLLYTLSHLDVANYLGVLDFNKVIILSLHPPFEPDSVVLCADQNVFSFNFRTKTVQGGFGNLSRLVNCIPVLLPRWPISIPPRLYAMYANKEGDGYLKKEDLKKAIECYTKSIVLFPTAVAYINRAKAKFNVSSFSEAEDDCTQALKIDDSCFEGYALRAVVRENLGNLEGCKEDEEVALRLKPMQ